MRLGALLGPIEDGGNPGTLVEQAMSLEAAGFESLWSSQAMGRGFMKLDPFVSLAAVATNVADIEIGTAILQVPLYHPMDLAHRIFSLQQLSGNRLIIGVGAGSTADDYRAYDRDFAARFHTFDQTVAQLRRILETGGNEESDLTPWPSVRGGPPLFYGTWGKGVVAAAEAYDGWIASGMHRTTDEVCAALQVYRAAGGGRAMVSTLWMNATTDLGELRERLGRLAAAGFDDAIVYFLPGAPTPEAVRKLVP